MTVLADRVVAEYVGAVRQQSGDSVHVSTLRGRLERGGAGGVGRVDVGVRSHQRLDASDVPAVCCDEDEWTPGTRAGHALVRDTGSG